MCKVKTKRIISAITVCLLCTAAVDQSSFSGEVLSARLQHGEHSVSRTEPLFLHTAVIMH